MCLLPRRLGKRLRHVPVAETAALARPPAGIFFAHKNRAQIPGAILDATMRKITVRFAWLLPKVRPELGHTFGATLGYRIRALAHRAVQGLRKVFLWVFPRSGLGRWKHS